MTFFAPAYSGGEYDDLPPWDEEEEKEDGE